MPKGEILQKEEGLTIARVSGRPYDLGFQHGEMFKEEINWFYSRVQKFFDEREGQIRGKISFFVIKRFAKKIEKFIPAELREEMDGLAKGAGVDYDFILLINVIEELSVIYRRLFKLHLPWSKGCSCFVAKTQAGIIWGRNLDYPVWTEFLPSQSILFVCQPSNGYSFLSLGWPGIIGVATAISKQNLSLILLEAMTKKWTWQGVPGAMATRQAIQYSQDIKIATEKFFDKPPTLGKNVVLVSKNSARVLELSSPNVASRDFNSPSPLVVTNHFQHETMKEMVASSFLLPILTVMPPEFFTLEGSQKRNQKLEKLCKDKEIDIARAKEVLNEVATPGTIQSMIFLPEKEEFWIAKSIQPPVTRGEWLSFKLKDLL